MLEKTHQKEIVMRKIRFLKVKNRYKPLYKQFNKLRENAQNRKKLLKLKRKKWDKLLHYYIKRLKIYRKFNPLDQTRYSVTKYATKGTSYKKRFRDSLNAARKFRLFYGGLTKKILKKQLTKLYSKKLDKKNYNNFKVMFLELFETRLDTILYKAKFSVSFRNARQLILHSKVLVNNKLITTPSYKVKQGDIISINPKYFYLIEKNLKNIQVLPIPPRHFTINYKTMEIIINNIKHSRLHFNFPFPLSVERVIVSYRKQ